MKLFTINTVVADLKNIKYTNIPFYKFNFLDYYTYPSIIFIGGSRSNRIALRNSQHVQINSSSFLQ